jgi:hypothetical protein
MCVDMGPNVALQKAGQLTGEYGIYTRHSAGIEMCGIGGSNDRDRW